MDRVVDSPAPSAPMKFADALSLFQRRDFDQADHHCEQLLREQPAHIDAWHLWGLVACERKQFERASGFFRRSLALNAAQPAVLANLGNALVQAQRAAEALDCFDRALALQPATAATLYGRGCALMQLKRASEALADLDAALNLQPDLAVALNVRGNALEALQRLVEALQSYDRALALQPGWAMAHHLRGLVLLGLQRPQEALAAADQAVRLAPGWAEGHQGRGIVLTRLQRPEEAGEAYARSLALRGDLPYLRGQTLHAFLLQADWNRSKDLSTAVVEANARGEAADEPLSFLAVSGSPEAQLQCARRYVADWYPQRHPSLWHGEVYEHEKIRIAYLSADFGEHPVSYLMAGVLERHDRRRFETLGLFLRPAEGAYGARVRMAFDRVLDVGSHSDEEIARRIREAEIDIVVDLMGFTRGGRLGVLSYRPAPVQLSYLGYPGAIGAPYIDYLLADEFVIPRAQRCHYTEAIAYLPDCFQANDAARALPPPASRAEAGLPGSGFVFCSFNASYKITPETFAIWCRLLHAAPHSVLWLLGDWETTRRNLRREAGSRGIAAERLIFAGRTDYPSHLARLQQADLFLDTSPFNAGTSASDALWAGVPVLTCPGEAFAARMAGSLLRAMELEELSCPDLGSYERLALELCGNPIRLQALKDHLRECRSSSALFDTMRFCRYLEQAYVEMHRRTRHAEPPADFTVL